MEPSHRMAPHWYLATTAPPLANLGALPHLASALRLHIQSEQNIGQHLRKIRDILGFIILLQ